MSYYARNHLQDDWASQAPAATAERLHAAERAAGWYFDHATRRQRSAYEAGLAGITGPESDLARDALRYRFRKTTADARTLFEETVQCLLDGGEISGELDEAWTALSAREDVVAAVAPE